MKLLFIYPDVFSGNQRHYHFGIGSMAGIIQKAGQQVSLLYLKEQASKEAFHEKIGQFEPDLIGISTTTNQWPFAKLHSQWIKEQYDIPVICGGIHPTLAPEEVISHKDIDIVCVGEGEFPMLDLLDCFEKGKDFSHIPNLWVKTSEGIIKNQIRGIIEDLDSIPYTDRSIFDYTHLLEENEHVLDIMAGRGCPYKCTYCSNPSFNELYRSKGKIVRRRQPEKVIEEITFLKERYQVHRVDFKDEIFTINREWLRRFCDIYRKEVHLPFYCMIRVETVDKDILRIMKEAGCAMIQVGIESGNEEIRRRIMGRDITNKDIIKVFRWADELGIKTWSFNMLGLPGETPKTIEDTINMNQMLRPNHIQISVFYPYPGTPLYKLCQEKGYLSEDTTRYSFFDGESVLNLPTISRKEIKDYCHKFHQIAQQIVIGKENQGDPKGKNVPGKAIGILKAYGEKIKRWLSRI